MSILVTDEIQKSDYVIYTFSAENTFDVSSGNPMEIMEVVEGSNLLRGKV